ncbi:MAG: restriction endonuclease subunit S [Anaerolineales bacterium]|nr:restriction endonuclease subunit S [Anaerolineales bacterium]
MTNGKKRPLEEWQPTRLGELIEVKHGWPFRSELFSEELTGRPIVVNIGNFEYTGGFRFESTKTREYRGDYPHEYELSPGAILLVMTCQTAGGEILGIPGRIPNDGHVYLHNQRLGKVVVKAPERVDIDYLYALFRWPEFNRELCLTASGTKILHTAPSRIEAFQFLLPPLQVQRSIGRTLRAFDDKIGLNRRMNETVEALARALFKSWFVDFDPVRAKAEGRQPVGMDAQTAALFPDSFVDSEIGKIPSGWQVKPLDEIANFLNGLALQKYPPQDNSFLPVVKIAQLRKGNTEAADRASAAIVSAYIVDDGDLLFSWSGSLEVVIWCGGRGALNQHLFKVTSAEYPKWLVYHWTRHHLPEFQRIAAGKATTMGHIQRHHLSQALTAVPPSETLKCMDNVVAPLLGRVVANNVETRTLAETRDTLLPRLISGEVRVNETVHHA